MKQPSFHDLELISAYLDDQLDAQARASLERRLETDPQLAAVYQSMRESRSLLRRLPQRRAPRNFTLTPQMAGIKPPLPRAYPVFRWASVMAALLFVFTFALNAGAPMLAARPMTYDAAPMLGMGGGPEVDQTMVVEAEPGARLQSGGGCEGEACATPEMSLAAAPTATPEGMRVMATQAEGEPAAKQPDAESLTTGSDLVAPQPVQPPVPGGVIGAMLAAAVLFAGAAYLVRWQTDRAFAQNLTQKRREK